MSESIVTPPDLDVSIKKLHLLDRSISSKSPKEASELYAAAVGLMCHLKTDQATLYTARNQGIDQCPPPEATPAITAVLQDEKLFRGLLQCLLSSSSSSADFDMVSSNAMVTERTSSGALVQHGGASSAAGRKRAYSLSGDPDRTVASKVLKLTHSPVPSSAKHKKLLYPSSGVNSKTSGSWSVQVVAATILYSAMQHLDHWPAPLVRAYAEDCFGPRLWVDDPRCRLLVENLALAAASRSTVDKQANETQNTVAHISGDAGKVADAYQNFEHTCQKDASNHQKCETQRPAKYQLSPRQQRRQGSMSSSTSSSTKENLRRSTSAESADSSTKLRRGKAASKRGDDADTGDALAHNKKGAKSPNMASKKKASDQVGESSSSGEEDDEVVLTAGAKNGEGKTKLVRQTKVPNGKATPSLGEASALYPLRQRNLNLERIRQRFFGVNLEVAHDAVASSLSDRLDVKTKQNSGLLQCLPSFTAIPGVRNLVASNLEKWLQSPALAGLARTLFSSTVNQMENVDPPLEEDLKAIDSILSMKLKANQFNAHMENVTCIAQIIPTGSVAQRMYSTLLSEVVTSLAGVQHSTDVPPSDQLKMVGAIHRALLAEISYDALAASLLTMLVTTVRNDGNNESKPTGSSSVNDPSERGLLVRRLKSVVRAIACELGDSFDGCLLMDSLLSYHVSSESWTIREEEDKARLMFQCATLSVSAIIRSDSSGRNLQRHQQTALTAGGRDVKSLSPKAKLSLRQTLRCARKILLTWCCTDYGPRFNTTTPQEKHKRNNENNETRKGGGVDNYDITAGVVVPDYGSALGRRTDEERIPLWMNTMRCLLFMEEAESPLMRRFLFPYRFMPGDKGEEAVVWKEELSRIKYCCDNGVDIDDDMIWIVLKASGRPEGKGISSEMALRLLENMFECCTRLRTGSLFLVDPMLIWELYNLSLYAPPQHTSKATVCSHADGNGEQNQKSLQNGEIVRDLPRLAYPGIWWRVTMLALVMCGASTGPIGAVVWKEHPTLRALIKMVISNRYRFPTIDSDETSREEMKKAEQGARDEETRIAEYLFLPPKRENKKKGPKAGSRVSKRLRKQQLEKEAAQELAETNRRKKLLRAAQKSIILWDPVGPARKPPREAAELLVSVEELFGLSEIFQRCLEPDFLLLTVGETTRGAIERAYGWLIPIISRIPETIARLPSNASGFLLLRAYGTEGDEQKELKELSAPLLRHVKDSLTGKFSESDSVTAFDLLMTDVASHNPDRRRCARRVLQDSLAGDATSNKRLAWMLNILGVKHAKALVKHSIRHMSKAATFERGRVLCSLTLALEKHISFAEQHGVENKISFPTLLMQLVSSRPSEFAEAMDANSDLLSLAIRVVHRELSRYTSVAEPRENNADEPNPRKTVAIRLYGESFGSTGSVSIELPLTLLETTSVLLSIWRTPRSRKEEEDDDDQEVASAVDDLVDAMMRSRDDEGGDFCEDDNAGLANAKVVETGWTALSVESWIILAKARSDLIARRAALSAPAAFLPRLLLCSGLPRASLLTMVDRLGRLGDSAEDKAKFYLELLVPSTSSKWDIGRVGQRREVSRRLLGRLSAYMRLNEVPLSGSEVSWTFLEWLSQDCKTQSVKPKRQKKRAKAAKPAKSFFPNVDQASCILSTINSDEPGELSPVDDLNDDDNEVLELLKGTKAKTLDYPVDMNAAQSIMDGALRNGQYEKLDSWLGELRDKSSSLAGTGEGIDLSDLSTRLLRAFRKAANLNDGVTATILKWVPVLSQSRGGKDLWEQLFSDNDLATTVCPIMDGLLTKCVSCWSEHHVSSCTDWIVSTSGAVPSEYSLDRVIMFFISTSGQRSVQVETFLEPPRAGSDDCWGNSESFVSAVTSIALARLKQSSEPLSEGYCSRNSLPPCLTLLLLLARCGRKQLQMVGDVMLRELSASPPNHNRFALSAVLLRIYLCFPHSMNLGSAAVRTALMKASEVHANTWTLWRCSVDDQLADLLETVMAGDLKVARVLAEKSRKHPLLILRKIGDMIRFLESDATARSRKPETDVRGVVLVQGQHLAGPREAKFAGKIVRVTVRHWGYSYTETVWVALLDILCAMPKEVLFSCGRQLGVQDFLALYVQLVSVQLHLRSADKAARLKSKISDVLGAFKETNPAGWREWLGNQVGNRQIRHFLVSCEFITPQEAIDSLKEPS